MRNLEKIQNNSSLAQKILKSGKPFNLFHTHTVAEETVQQAISENKSIDLDIAVNKKGEPYLGHSEEYHTKSGEPFFQSMPLWSAVNMIAKSNIAVIVDYKQPESLSTVGNVIRKIGAERCLVHIFASEFKFDFSRKKEEPDYLSEWMPIETLRELKEKFPSVTTTASCKWLPEDLLTNMEKHMDVLQKIRTTLKENSVDTVCLNIPNDTFSDKSLKFFSQENIIPHVGIDDIDTAKLSEIYIGETDILEKASKINTLN